MFFASWASRLLTILSLICCAYPADLDEKCVMEVEWDWPKDGSFSVLDGGLQGHWSQGIDVHVTTPETRMSDPPARHALHHLGGIPYCHFLGPLKPKFSKNLCTLHLLRNMRTPPFLATSLPFSIPLCVSYRASTRNQRCSIKARQA